MALALCMTTVTARGQSARPARTSQAHGMRSAAANFFGTPVFDQTVQTTVSSTLRLDSLQNFMKQLCGMLPVMIGGSSVYIPHRYAGNGSTQFRNAAEHIANIFARYGLSPVIENNATPWTKINVVGTLPGRRAEYIVLCGHFDSANNTCPGSDDNASGTCAVLEAARILRGMQFEYTIKFIAFGGEEQGMKGSAQYMTAHASDSIRASINCDMIEWDADTNRVLQIHAIANAGGQYSEDMADYVVAVNGAYSLPNVCQIHLPGITASDHSSFWNKNRSALLFIEEYGSDFNPYYHTGNDSWRNMDVPGNQALFLNATKLTVASAMHLAQLVQPTPVTLVAFSATVTREADVLLRWSTASEINNAGFRIERAATPLGDFEPLGFVPARNGSATHEYLYTDASVPRGRWWYRLRQVDTDGTETLSHAVVADVGIDPASPLLYALYPNPATSAATISYSLSSDARVSLRVLDMLGREVALIAEGIRATGTHQENLNVSRLPAGSYVLLLETSAGSTTRRLSVTR
jgi:hypothetical protein